MHIGERCVKTENGRKKLEDPVPTIAQVFIAIKRFLSACQPIQISVLRPLKSLTCQRDAINSLSAGDQTLVAVAPRSTQTFLALAERINYIRMLWNGYTTFEQDVWQGPKPGAYISLDQWG